MRPRPRGFCRLKTETAFISPGQFSGKLSTCLAEGFRLLKSEGCHSNSAAFLRTTPLLRRFHKQTFDLPVVQVYDLRKPALRLAESAVRDLPEACHVQQLLDELR